MICIVVKLTDPGYWRSIGFSLYGNSNFYQNSLTDP